MISSVRRVFSAVEILITPSGWRVGWYHAPVGTGLFVNPTSIITINVSTDYLEGTANSSRRPFVRAGRLGAMASSKRKMNEDAD